MELIHEDPISKENTSKEEAAEKKHILRISKLALLNSKNKVQFLTKNEDSTLLSAHVKQRAEMSAIA